MESVGKFLQLRRESKLTVKSILFLQPLSALANPPELTLNLYPPSADASAVIVTGNRFATTINCPVEERKRVVWNEVSLEHERCRASFVERGSAILVKSRVESGKRAREKKFVGGATFLSK
jgi:hypothetical protein